MVRRLIVLLLSIAMLFSLPLGLEASAAGVEYQVLSAYRTEDTLYTFVDIDREKLDKFKASTAELGGQTADPENLLEGKVNTSYVVLLDTTESMQENREMVEGFLKTLLGNKLWQSRVVLVPYTSSPHLNSITDTYGLSRDEGARALEQALNSIQWPNTENLAYYSCIFGEKLLK